MAIGMTMNKAIGPNSAAVLHPSVSHVSQLIWSWSLHFLSRSCWLSAQKRYQDLIPFYNERRNDNVNLLSIFPKQNRAHVNWHSSLTFTVIEDQCSALPWAFTIVQFMQLIWHKRFTALSLICADTAPAL